MNTSVIDTIDTAIAPFTIAEIRLYMEVLLYLAKGRSNVPGSELNRRGYMTIMNGKTGEIVITLPFGEIPPDKNQNYFEFSQEKAHRLFLHKSSHTNSFQSRNIENGEYGGAIYVKYGMNEFIFSFSGMPELIDEAMMIALSDKLAMDHYHGLISQSECRGRNPYWTRLLSDFLNHELIVSMEGEIES